MAVPCVPFGVGYFSTVAYKSGSFLPAHQYLITHIISSIIFVFISVLLGNLGVLFHPFSCHRMLSCSQLSHYYMDTYYIPNTSIIRFISPGLSLAIPFTYNSVKLDRSATPQKVYSVPISPV
jgi:hypothetical protein